MFERFTDRARRVVVLAQDEARLLRHNYIGTEHILLGLIHEGEGVAARALESLGISLEMVRHQVEEIIGEGQVVPSGHIPFTPRAKKVLELSLREALDIGHNYIGTEHLLLGLIREGHGVAAQVLVALGADLSRVRQQVIDVLAAYQGRTGEAGQAPARSASAEAGRQERPAAALAGRIRTIEARLSAIELRLGSGPDLRDLDEKIAQAAVDKQEAVAAERYERAAALRNQERRLLTDRAALMNDWAEAHPSLPSLAEEVILLRSEVARLRGRIIAVQQAPARADSGEQAGTDEPADTSEPADSGEPADTDEPAEAPLAGPASEDRPPEGDRPPEADTPTEEDPSPEAGPPPEGGPAREDGPAQEHGPPEDGVA
jgi:ATP-dependent Clp protease ATP-binding subunit ClpA